MEHTVRKVVEQPQPAEEKRGKLVPATINKMKANPSAVVGAVDERPSQCLTMSLIAECTKTDRSSAGDAGADGNTDERHAMFRVHRVCILVLWTPALWYE